MRIGKRRPDAAPPAATEPGTATPAEPAPEPVALWTAPADAEPPVQEAGESEAVVVEGEAVELPPEPTPAGAPPAAEVPDTPPPAAPVTPPPAARSATPPPGPAPPAVAAEPVAVVSSAGEPIGVTPLQDSAEAYASGHAAAPGAPPAWQEPLQALVAERPEVVVGAAFVGGLLTAMILRRLGN